MEIRRLLPSDATAFYRFQALLLEEKTKGPAFFEVKQVDDFEAFLEKSRRLETQADQPNWSPMTSYYAFINGEIAGKISCRWELDKGDLATVGGHVGYVVSPLHRRQGVATALLQAACDQFRQRGIGRILITANEANIGSRRTIEKLGGQLENTLHLPADYPNLHIAGHALVRYWITL